MRVQKKVMRITAILFVFMFMLFCASCTGNSIRASNTDAGDTGGGNSGGKITRVEAPRVRPTHVIPQETQGTISPLDWSGTPNGKEMTLDDVRELAAKGDDLVFEDLWQYKGANSSSSINRDHYLMVYGVEGGYRLVVSSNPSGKPEWVNLESIWEYGGSGIDIRYNNVDEFLRNNPSQEAVTEEQAQDIIWRKLGVEVEPVSWYILGDWPERTDRDAVFARALLDSVYTLDESCKVFREKGAPEWGGRHYYAFGNKSGTVFICSPADNGELVWDSAWK